MYLLTDESKYSDQAAEPHSRDYAIPSWTFIQSRGRANMMQVCRLVWNRAMRPRDNETTK